MCDTNNRTKPDTMSTAISAQPHRNRKSTQLVEALATFVPYDKIMISGRPEILLLGKLDQCETMLHSLYTAIVAFCVAFHSFFDASFAIAKPEAVAVEAAPLR